MEKKIALVTGANKGLGLETCRQLLNLGYLVILTSRNQERGELALKQFTRQKSNISFCQLDVSDQNSVLKCKEHVEKKYTKIDVLVNNAGLNYDTWNDIESIDLNEAHVTMEVNMFGAWRMANAFIPLLKKSTSPRIVNVSSGAGSLKDTGNGAPAYCISKAAMNMLTVKLAERLTEDNFKVNSICPGWVRTDMGGQAAPRSLEVGARGIIWAATLESDGPTGGFFRDGRRINW